LSDEKLLIFFGDSTDADMRPLPTHEQHDEARTMCYGCPVQMDCLEYCIITEQKHGVWGGLTESQRKRYLYPALRKHGLDPEAINAVVAKCGERILRRIDPIAVA
jgi:hypothetical protein